MRSVKLLWGTVGVLLAAIIVLVVLLVRNERPYAHPPQEYPETKEPNVQQSRTVAVIGGVPITYEQLQRRLMEKHGAETLEQMLDREAVRLESEELHVTVKQNEIDAELKRMQQGYNSEEHFFNLMQEQLGLSKQEVYDDLTHRMLLERLAVRGIPIREADVDAYIKNHPEEFASYVQYHLYQIEVRTREEAVRIATDVRNGADFTSLAERFSLDEETASKGGDLGWIEENDLFVPKAFLEAARTMQLGEVSRPIPVGSRFAVIMLMEKKVVNKLADEQRRAFIRHELALQKAVPLNELVKSLRLKWQAQIVDAALIGVKP